MSKLIWDKTGEHFYENGIDRCVFYSFVPRTRSYGYGVAWNGLTSLQENSSGGESTKIYADNLEYLNLRSAEEFNATIEALTYPEAFALANGFSLLAQGISLGQQKQKTFGLSYRTKVGSEITEDVGFKIHLIYGAMAKPSEKSHETINNDPNAVQFSWEINTTPVSISGFRPVSHLMIDTRKIRRTRLRAIEKVLYGTDDTEPRMPLPNEIASIMTTNGHLITGTGYNIVLGNKRIIVA